MNAMDQQEELLVRSIEQVEPLWITSVDGGESEGELYYRDYIERQNPYGEFLDETLVLGRIKETGEFAIRVPGVGIFSFESTAVPTAFLNHIEHGIFGGYMAIMSNGDRVPVYHFSNNTTRVYRFRYRGGPDYLDNLRTIFEIPSTKQFGTVEPGIDPDAILAEYGIAGTSNANDIPRSKSRGLTKQ